MGHKALRAAMATFVAVAMLCIAFGLLWFAAGAQGAHTFYVAPGGNCGGSSPCYGHPQQAVDAAAEGDLIKVAAGTYWGVTARPAGTGTSTKPVTQVVYLNKTLTVHGGYTTTNWDAPVPDAHRTVLDARGEGRVLYISGFVSATLESLELTGGKALGHHGGGAYVISATAIFSGCRVYGNRADIGGGLSVRHAAVVLTGNTISNNLAESKDGGGLSAEDASGIMLVGNRISDNAAARDGGGLKIERSTATLNGNAIEANTAARSGGGLALEEAAATVEGNVVSRNTAADDGGGLVVDGGSASLNSNVLVANIAADAGGGLYLKGASTTSLKASEICTNTAKDGGGMCLARDSTATFTGNQVAGNTAQRDGGGLCLRSTVTATVMDNTIRGNSAGDDGGGLYLDHCTVTLIRNAISQNAADGDGGGVTLRRNSHMHLSESLLLGNTAQDDGGGLYVASGVPFTMTNNVVATNQAADAGDGLWVVGTPVGFTAGVLRHNTFVSNGGTAVHAEISATLYFTNTIIASHSTGISVTTGSLAHLEGTLWGSGRWANQADWAGAGIITGTVNRWGDPAFVNPIAGDYHIGSHSAAVDAGVDAGIRADMDGHPRPLGAGFDIGADEYFRVVAVIRLPVVLKGR